MQVLDTKLSHAIDIKQRQIKGSDEIISSLQVNFRPKANTIIQFMCWSRSQGMEIIRFLCLTRTCKGNVCYKRYSWFVTKLYQHQMTKLFQIWYIHILMNIRIKYWGECVISSCKSTIRYLQNKILKIKICKKKKKKKKHYMAKELEFNSLLCHN